jgi:3-oxoacyl-(acyl-carrier-protein) synthase
MSESPRVAIVAAEAWTALGESLATTFEAMARGAAAVREVAGLGPGATGARIAGLDEGGSVAGPGGRVATPHGEVLDRVLAAVHAAARGAALEREAVGLYVATGMVDSRPADLLPALAASRREDGAFDAGRFLDDGFRSVHPLWPLAMLPNVVVGQAAADLDVRGDHLVTGPEADAGVSAIAAAAQAVLDGAVAGALAAGLSESVGAASLARARLRRLENAPLGEGGAALWLEREDAAAGRGLAPLARLSGWATALGEPAAAIASAAREALALAGRSPDDVALVVVDGLGTSDADARRALFGARRAAVATMAPAAAVGHLLAGAPPLGVGLAALALASGHAPSSAGGAPRRLREGGAALVLATGSGGGAGALVVERAS